MSKYLKLFETDAEYQQFIGGGDFLRPNVSLVTDTNSVYYNPLEKELPYLTMTALEDGLTVSLSTNPCQYSLNGTEWNELQAGEQTPTISSGKKIYFKAEGLAPNGPNGIGKFTVSKPFNLSGNVMSMLFGDEAEGKIDLTGYDYAFSNLFPKTPVVNVSSNFLPATTLATNCYMGMFYGCTSLVQTPELPATTLADGCYNRMFYGCTSLNYIKMLATDISATLCLNNWVSNVSPTGTFVKSKDATWNVTGVSGIPEGWIVETA